MSLIEVAVYALVDGEGNFFGECGTGCALSFQIDHVTAFHGQCDGICRAVAQGLSWPVLGDFCVSNRNVGFFDVEFVCFQRPADDSGVIFSERKAGAVVWVGDFKWNAVVGASRKKAQAVAVLKAYWNGKSHRQTQ